MMYPKILFAIVVFAILGACKTDLLSNLTEKEANEIIIGLNQNNIDVDKKLLSNGQYVVRVEEADKAIAMGILDNYGLPRPSNKTCDQLHPKGSGFIISRVEEEEKKRCNKQVGVAQQLLLVPNATEARVELVLPEQNPLASEPLEASASVVMTFKYNAVIPPLNEIKRIVVNAVPNLEYENISLFVSREESVLEKSTDIADIEESRRLSGSGGFGGGSGSMIIYVVVGMLILIPLLAAFLYRRGVKEREAQYRELIDDEDDSVLPNDGIGPTLGGGYGNSMEIDADPSTESGMTTTKSNDPRLMRRPSADEYRFSKSGRLRRPAEFAQ